ncbi:MAG TPA: hypothetical protein VM241_04775 [Candidatus Thermoplasmatota archaeon]|nr:hypothetical protein [Candidatus Thermoplasmatota archaeon]
MPGLSYRLLLDGAPPAPGLLEQVRLLEVEDHAAMAGMLRLRVGVGVKPGGSGWNVLDDGLFGRLSKVRVSVQVGARSEALIETHVVDARATLSNAPGGSALDVVAMDGAVLLSLDEVVKAWPNMADGDIATAIFANHGLVPVVDATQPARQELAVTTVQRGTDLAFLRQLAARNGFECFVALNPRTGVPEGHFHKPKLDAQPQGVLSVNLGPATNVNRFEARHDMLRPVAAEARGVDVATASGQSGQAEDQTQKVMGQPAPGGRRKVLLSGSGLSDAAELQTLAQAVADQSSWAVTAEGELNTAAYGGVLRARQPVLVRGAGQRFSGLYYVERVLHSFSDAGHVQRFSLRRNGLGVTPQDNYAGGGAA